MGDVSNANNADFTKAAFTRCRLARASQVLGMRLQTLHASKIMEVATLFKVIPVELPITCLKRLHASPGLHSREKTCIV
jgi:hypothetical protein